MIKKQNISQFKGLNAGVRPELIEDDQASELVNFRFNRRGAIATRQGVVMFDVPEDEGEQLGLQGKGVSVIAEYRLENWDTTFDTDSFLLIGQRTAGIIDAGSGSATPPQYAIRYILMPTTGADRNKLSGDNCEVFTTCDDPNGNALPGQLAAPRRQVSNLQNLSFAGKIIDRNWITHYSAATQFRNKMVISDMTNGDLLLGDTYDDAVQGEDKTHEYYLRQNSLATMNIDTVTVDFGLNGDGFNDAGVESGIALYKFYLPRKTAIAADDRFGDYWSGTQADNHDKLRSLTDSGSVNKFAANNTFMTAGIFYETNNTVYKGLGVNGNNRYTFSDVSEAAEIIDLFGKATTTNPAVLKETERAADVFIWDKVKVTYFPCSGASQYANGKYYLRGRDRTFDKMTALVPRTVKLTTKTGAALDVPLAVWRYRFVWDMGGGEYSAPSSELPVPDILWSALKDDAIPELTSPEYRRPVRPEGQDEFGHTCLPAGYADFGLGTTFISNSANHNAAPLVFGGTAGAYVPPDIEAQLTTYGKIFKNIKDELYKEVNHRFGSLYAYSTWSDFYLTGEFGVIAAADFGSGTTKKLDGIICEYAQDFENNDDEEFPYKKYATGKISLTIPLRRGNAQEYYNSIFTDTGIYRHAFKTTQPGTFAPTDVPRWQLVLFHFSLPTDYVDPFAAPFLDGVQDYKYGYLWHFALDDADHGIVFNIVPNETAASVSGETLLSRTDFNNAPETNSYAGTYPLSAVRDPAQFRAVTKQSDRLSYIAPDIPAEASSRLIAEGTAELVLADFDERGTITHATEDAALRAWTDILVHDRRRHFTEIETVNAPRTINFVYKWRWWENTTSLRGGPPSSGYHGPYIESGGSRRVVIDNVRVAIHGDGERLMIPEQLTAYFTSSALWNAPRVKLKIASADIPPRAKRLIIFRTIATHNNDWTPDNFGKIGDVGIVRDGSGVATDIEFFDLIKDKDVDFGVSPDEYDGLTTPLKSRFNIALLDSVWYAHFTETYQPLALRDNISALNAAGLARLPQLSIDSATGGKLAAPRNVLYALMQKDPLGVRSAPKFYAQNAGNSPALTLGTGDIVQLGLLPSASGQGIITEIWRGINVSGAYTWSKIGEVKPEDEGVFIDDDAAILEAWNGKYEGGITGGLLAAPPLVTEAPSGLRWSRANRPGHIKFESFEPVRDGDGDQITGLAMLRGSLIIFKERSIHRITLLPGEVLRKDEVSNTLGCVAPNTIMTFNNEVFFLHRSGFYRYDNNGFQRADGDILTELITRITRTEAPGAVHNSDVWGKTDLHPGVRDASTGYNPVYNEIYLNVPTYRDNDAATLPTDSSADFAAYYPMRGHVYVISLDTGYVTKFAYRQADASANARTQGRLYCNTRSGQLRSAQILPEDFAGFSLLLLESPTDVYVDSIPLAGDTIDETITPEFPDVRTQVELLPVQSLWRSKHYDFGDKSITKRLLKFVAHVRKATAVTLGGASHNEDYDGRIAQDALWWKYNFAGRGELTAVPPRTAAAPGAEHGGDVGHVERGERLAVQIETEGEAFIDSCEFYWKPVNAYMR